VFVWGLLPIAVITLIAIAVAGFGGAYEPPGVMAVLDVFCLTIPMLFAAVLAMRNYLAGRAPAVLLVGASSLIVGAGALLEVVKAGGSSAGSKFVVYSTAALLGGMGFLGAAVLSRLTTQDGPSRRLRLVTAWLSYAALVLLLVMVSQLTRTATWPAYFVQGSGLTRAGMVTVRLAALMFVMAAAAMALLPGRSDLGLRRWYAVGLGLFAVGLASWSLQVTAGDSLNWMGRGSQYLGSLVILSGLVLTARTTGGWSLPLERDLLESRERYEALARLSLDGIIVLEEGRVSFANDAAATMFGSPSIEELRGREIHTLVHPENHAAFEEMLEGSARGEMGSPVRARLTGAADNVTDVVITGSEASFRGTRPLQLVLHDVSSLERVTLALKDSEDRLALALEAVHCGTWELDLASMALQRGPGFEVVLGLESLAPDWTHQQLLERILPEDRAMVARVFIDAVEARGELAVECRVARQDGSVSWIRLAGRCRPDSSGRWKLTGVIQEITSLKECEAALEKTVDEIQATTEENDRLRRRELVAADAVQTSLLHVPSTIGPLRLSHMYRSATDQAAAGGDFFDAFRLANDRVALLIGDVAGHGVDATRAATLTKNLIHAYAPQITRPEQILYRANGFLVDTALPGFITLFLGILDLKTMQLRYSSAGHPEGLLRRAGGSIEPLSSGSAPLAVYPEVSWMQWSVQLEDGDLLFLYTDGVIEARKDGDLFGEDRLQNLVRRKGANAQLLPGLVLDNILAFSADRLQDDVAILAVEITEEASDFEEAS
jgi:PAS domain S-box-containing protein